MTKSERMQVLLMRHGSAGPATGGMPDRERRLTSEGIEQVRSVSRRAAAVVPTPVVVASPYRRALETAGIAVGAWDAGLAISRSGALTPESSPAEAWDEIRAHRGVECLLLVGHEPLFSSLTAYLLGFPELAIEFSPATTACVEVLEFGVRPRGILKWLLPAGLA